MNFDQAIGHCPRCGSGDFPQQAPRFFRCVRCDFHFHVNCATAVVGVVADAANCVLFSVPGGFVDADESAETALARELREEVNLELTA